MEGIVGKRFGRLTVVEKGERSGHDRLYLCKCDCGNTIIVRGGNLISGTTKSCGCLRRENTSRMFSSHGHANKERLYYIWMDMRRRCDDMSDKNYGGRGISVCDAWNDDYAVFRNWALSNGYKEDLTIDRIDVNGNYCPENCRWATYKEQGNNTRVNRLIEYMGQTHTLTEWADIYGVDEGLIRARIDRFGWSVEKALNTPPYSREKRYDAFGESHTLREWSAIYNIKTKLLWTRICVNGWSVEKALTTPVRKVRRE